jgi:N-glycosylase/DNA lyase
MKLIEITAQEFDLAKTLASGQVFHWERIGDGFGGTIGDQAVYVEQRGDVLKIRAGQKQLDCFKQSSWSGTGSEKRIVGGTVARYFALDHPLAQICASFPQDETMKAAGDFCRGLRIIRQPKWECLATFICSSMKQVAHIRQISQALRRRFGEARKIGLQRSIQNAHAGSGALRAMLIDSAPPTFVNIEQGTARSTCNHTVYTFPAPARLAKSSEKDLRECALGYRAKNLLATARLVTNGDVDLEKWAALADVDLRAKLCELPGVGAKVANCVMLFAYERLRAFPIDVWIERVLHENYFPRARKLNATRLRTFTQEHFGEHGGYAQQYLFHHARMNKQVDRGRRAVGAKKNGTRPAFVPQSRDLGLASGAYPSKMTKARA